MHFPQRWSTIIPHALIIEDEYWLAIEMKEALTKLGYATCDFASSMTEAIAAAERGVPDLIVADQMIVGGTGTEAILTICSENDSGCIRDREQSRSARTASRCAAGGQTIQFAAST